MLSSVGQLAAIFLVGLLLPTFPFLPVRLAVLIPFAAATIHPLLVTLVASVATSLGTLPLYAFSNKAVDAKVVKRWLRRPWVRSLLQFLEGKMFLAILIFALLPLPDQLMSVLSGIKRYSPSKTALGFFLGRLPYFLLLSYFGASHRALIEQTSHWLVRSFSW